ncbi:hypothetical protein [Streptomyces sp. NPDC014656]|uniref:MmyB family transcriptional regulator n=1 Tax=Streptomyces sp. NPDC014656 TaxID=3364878 RepID=UPI0036F4C556
MPRTAASPTTGPARADRRAAHPQRRLPHLWAAHDGRIRHEGTERLRHPEAGPLELTHQSVDLPVSG